MIAKYLMVLIGLYTLSTSAFAQSPDNPCVGQNALLSIVDRPNNADSPCTVPFKKVEMEFGFQSQQLSDHGGSLQNFPEPELRLGLPMNSELFILLPNAIRQSSYPGSGYSNTAAGLKHQLAFSEDWIVSVEGVLYLPNGSTAYGNQELGAAFNGIWGYTINPKWNFTAMIGGASVSDSRLSGGERYNTFNPTLVLSYAITETLNAYGEYFAQSKTGAGQGWGSNFDAGVLYLITPHLVLDVSAGQRINGMLGGWDHYVGMGFSFMN